MYSCQTQNKTERELRKFFKSAFREVELYSELYGKNFKAFYRNKPTKRLLQIAKELQSIGDKSFNV